MRQCGPVQHGDGGVTKVGRSRAKNPAYRPNLSAPFPSLLTVQQIRERLDLIFPAHFADRGILVGVMAARVVFVALYGGLVEGAGRYLRPSFVYLFTEQQSKKISFDDRYTWVSKAHVGGFRPEGERWYADTSKEPIRDDLIRNRLLLFGAMGRNTPDEHSKTASTPVYFLLQEFSALFEPDLDEVVLLTMITAWRQKHLSPGTLQRMTLRAEGAQKQKGDIYVDMPNGERLRLSSGVSNQIVKALIEEFADIHLQNPIVLWISASDRKSYPQFQQLSESLGLYFDIGAELPDLILGDMGDPVTFYFCEIVATDGPVTDARKEALSSLIRASAIREQDVRFLTAFEDREASPFRKVFSQLATDSLVWFRTEPDLIVIISQQTRWQVGDSGGARLTD